MTSALSKALSAFIAAAECFEGEVVWPGQPSTSPPTTPSSPFEMGSGASTGPHSHDVMIVIYGLVKSSFVDHKGELQEYYLGSGGVIGLLQALVGAPLPGTGLAIAQGDALHRGPVLFLIPAAVVRSIAAEAAAGDVALHQLEIDMYRVAGLYVVERLQTQVAAQVTAACCREAASNGEEVSIREGQRAARKAVAAVRHALRDARVVRLAAGAKHAQHGHIVVLQGSLVSGQAEGEEELQGPAVLPWLPSLLGTDKVSGRAPKLWAAGGSGAVLLVCPTEPRGAKRHPEDAEVGASDGGADEIVTMAPFSEVSRAAFGLPGDVIEAKLNDGRPVPAPDQSTAMDALPGGSDVIAAAAEQQQAEHMASQRLPLSASILHLEALKGTVHGQ